uniref:FYVE-type domain-containing protein n=1 Tax=Globisporangium ultimum (strain ATCC 200006 / CBS 805.95 / DAOM BR144) TaxID=431595 RepID=K3WEZ9_GLOUD
MKHATAKTNPRDAVPVLDLSPSEATSIGEQVDRIALDTIAAFDAFVESNRQFPKNTWKLVKTRGELCAYRTRRHRSSPESQLRATAPRDGRHMCETSETHISSSSSSDDMAQTVVMEERKQKTPPLVVVSGIVPGTLEDVMYGNVSDSDATWRLRSHYLKDAHHDCKMLATIRRPSAQDPFRFLALRWSLKKFPVFMKMRDVVYAESSGVVRDSVTNQITAGYNIMHSIELPGRIPDLAPDFDILRFSMSLCFVARAYDARSTEIYCRAVCLPGPNAPESISTLIYAENLLNSVNGVSCAVAKKLVWLSQERERQRFQYTKRTLATATHCQGCLRGLKLVGGLSRSAAVCQCCRRIVCGKCHREKKVVVDVDPQTHGVVAKALVFCLQCVAEATEMSAMTIVNGSEPAMSLDT